MTRVDPVTETAASPPASAAPAAGAGTRERLVQAATELILRDGYAAASVVAVTERVGVAAGTLYRHFPSKAALFVEVFRSVCGRELEVVRAAVDARDTPAGRIDAVVETFAGRALRRPRLAWALLSEPIDALVDAERLVYRRDYRDLISAIIREGVAAGDFADQDPGLSAAAMVGAIGDALVGPLSPAGSDPADGSDHLIVELSAFCRRSVGAVA